MEMFGGNVIDRITDRNKRTRCGNKRIRIFQYGLNTEKMDDKSLTELKRRDQRDGDTD